MICKKCGQQLGDNVSFCPSCGANLKEEQSNNQNGYNQNYQEHQNSYSQNNYNQSSYNQNGYNQNQQFNQNGYNQNQQFNQNGYNQNQQFNQNGYNQQNTYNAPNRFPIKERNIVMCIILSFITCGIYGIIWFISLVDDLNMAADEPNATSGGMVFLLSIVTCGIYMFFWMYKAGELMNTAKYKRGYPTDSNSGILYLLLTFFGLGIVTYCLIQSDLNKMATM